MYDVVQCKVDQKIEKIFRTKKVVKSYYGFGKIYGKLKY